MKLVGSEGGRAIVVYAAEEIRPDQGLFLPDVVKKIAERYEFATIPNVADLKGDFSAVSFKTGCLTLAAQKVAIHDFTILQGAMSVDSIDTDISEKFFEDAIAWARDNIGLKPFQTAPRYFFLSNIVVDFERGVDSFLAFSVYY